MPRLIPQWMDIDEHALLGIAQAWAKEDGKLDDIFAAYATKGGWEGWFQVELTRKLILFTEQMQGYGVAMNSVVNREADVYANSDMRVDIMMTVFMHFPHSKLWSFVPPAWHEAFDGQLAHFPSHNVVIELKCESLQNAANFKSGVKADLQKLRNYFKPGVCEGTTEPLIVLIAISITAEGAQSMEEIETTEGLVACQAYLGRSNHSIGEMIAIMWIFKWEFYDQVLDRPEQTVDPENCFDDVSKQNFVRNTTAERNRDAALQLQEPVTEHFIWDRSGAQAKDLRDQAWAWAEQYWAHQWKNPMCDKFDLQRFYLWHFAHLPLVDVTDVLGNVILNPRTVLDLLSAADISNAQQILRVIKWEELQVDPERVRELEAVQHIRPRWDQF